jgi:hypothetical protein
MKREELNPTYEASLRLETVPFLKTDYIGFYTRFVRGRRVVAMARRIGA